MKTNFALTGALALLLAGFGVAAARQGGQQRPSPGADANCAFSDGATIKVHYSSPRMKGRKIYADDGLVPFGQVWRAGANEATTFVVSSDVTVGDLQVPKGNYTLFVIPAKDKWTLIVHKKTGEWGIPYPGEQGEFGRTGMKVGSLPSPLEDFTISFDQAGGACKLNMDWETTRSSVSITEKK